MDLFREGCERRHEGRRCRRTPSFRTRVGRRCSSCTPARLAGLPEPTPLYVQERTDSVRQQPDAETGRKVLRALRRYLAMRDQPEPGRVKAPLPDQGLQHLPPRRLTELAVEGCGCTTSAARTVVDQVAHVRFHRLVVEQGGPAGAVNAHSLRLARGGDAHRLRSAS